MSTDPTISPWRGRIDGDGPEHARWHQQIRVVGPDHPETDRVEHVSVLGFRSDEGVRRNAGRQGAADGPRALRAALSSFALHAALAESTIELRDLGDAITHGEDLEGGQEAATTLITRALDAPGNRLAVVLGGGHETAWATYRGLLSSQRMTSADSAAVPRWGVVNLDAHFDLRRAPRPTSGTPFLQMAEAEAAQGRSLNYAVFGIAEPSNTPTLFATARRLGVQWMTDVECAERGAAGVTEAIQAFLADLDVVYLTLDLDVLPASVMPAVSAPAAYGVDPSIVMSAVRTVAASGKLAVMDIVELNPSLDPDGRSAKMAARLIDETVRAALQIRA